jgi:hypothetical protein
MNDLKENHSLKLWGVICILFYLCYGFFLFNRFGLGEGFFFTFSLLAFLGLGISCIRKNSGLALASLALALPHLFVWILDAIWFCFFKASLFGIAESRFQPGLTKTDFFLSYYPLLLLPLAFALPRYLPKLSRPPFLLTGLMSVIVLLLSRFLLLGMSDPNCSRLACFPGFSAVPVAYYPWAFLIFYTLIALVIVQILTLYFTKANGPSPIRRHYKVSLTIYFLFSASIIGSDIQRFNSTPRFFCQSAPPTDGVELNCKYTLDYSPGFFALFFLLKNTTSNVKHCNLYLTHKDKRESMYQAVLIRGNNRLKLNVILPYPTDPTGSVISLSSECESLR